MDFDNKHMGLALEHIEDNSLEEIFRTAINYLLDYTVQANKFLPDNPWGLIYRSLLTIRLKSVADVEEDFFEKFTSKYQSQPEGDYGITQIPHTPIFGLRSLLKLLDPPRLSTIQKRILPFITDSKKMIEETQVELFNALGGGFIFLSRYLPASNSAPTPIELYNVFEIKHPSIDAALNKFANYVVEDVVGLTRSGQQFNVFIKFTASDIGGKKTRVRLFESDQFAIPAPQSTVLAIKQAAQRREKLSLRLLLRVRNPESNQGTTRITSVQQSLVIPDQDYVYFFAEKIYILHHAQNEGRRSAQGKSAPPMTLLSYSHAPAFALARGVFSTRQSAVKYASFYRTLGNTSAIKQKELKQSLIGEISQNIREKYQASNMIHAIWHVLFYMVLEEDSIRRSIIPSLLVVLGSTSTFNESLRRWVKVLRMLCQEVITLQERVMREQAMQRGFISSSDLENAISVYLKDLHNIFKLCKEKTDSVMSGGDTAEMLLWRDYLYKQLESLTAPNKIHLRIERETVRTLHDIEGLLKGIANQQAAHTVILLPFLREVVRQFVAPQSEEKKQGKEVLTLDALQSFKQTKYVVLREREVMKNQKTRRYPAKEAESHVLFQYLVDTGIFQHLYLMIWDAIFEPQFPNLKVIVEKKTMANVIKFDLLSDYHDAVILQKHLEEPRQSKDASSSKNQYILVTHAMKQFDSPLVLGREYVLKVCAPDDLSFTRKLLYTINLSRYQFNHIPPEYTWRSTLSFFGTCIFNKSKRTPAFWAYNQWSLCLDFFIEGPNQDEAQLTFFKILAKYAAYLNREDNVWVAGLFVPDFPSVPVISLDSNPGSEIEEDEDVADLARSISGQLLAGQPAYLKVFYFTAAERTFKRFEIYFNLHYATSKTTAHKPLLSVKTFRDLSKVFFSTSDANLWEEVIRGFSAPDVDKVFVQEANQAYQKMQFMRSVKLRVLRASFREDQASLPHYMRILFSFAERLDSLEEQLRSVMDLVLLYNASKESANRAQSRGPNLRRPKSIYSGGQSSYISKVKVMELSELKDFFMKTKADIEDVLLDEHNVYFEGVQPRAINLLSDCAKLFLTTQRSLIAEEAFDSLKEILQKVKKIADICRLIGNSAIMSYESYLQDQRGSSLFR